MIYIKIIVDNRHEKLFINIVTLSCTMNIIMKTYLIHKKKAHTIMLLHLKKKGSGL